MQEKRTRKRLYFLFLARFLQSCFFRFSICLQCEPECHTVVVILAAALLLEGIHNGFYDGKADAASGEEALPEARAGLRTNLAETAFFYPQLRTNEQGEVSFSFTMPESLTRWNFRGYAHTKGMLMGTLDGEAITSKEFMLTPNLPI